MWIRHYSWSPLTASRLFNRRIFHPGQSRSVKWITAAWSLERSSQSIIFSPSRNFWTQFLRLLAVRPETLDLSQGTIWISLTFWQFGKEYTFWKYQLYIFDQKLENQTLPVFVDVGTEKILCRAPSSGTWFTSGSFVDINLSDVYFPCLLQAKAVV